MAFLELKQVSFRYFGAEEYALSDLSLTVAGRSIRWRKKHGTAAALSSHISEGNIGRRDMAGWSAPFFSF